MRIPRTLYGLFLVVGICGGVGAQTGSTGNAAAAVRIERGISFAVVDGLDLTLDLYVPEGVDNPPLNVWLYGGGWRARVDSDDGALALLGHGFAVARPTYRLTPQAAFPAQIHDIKASIRFLRANAERLGIDPSRVVISGASAGAHLAALVAVTNGSEEHEGSLGAYLDTSSDVQALVSYFGASNLTSILDQSTPFGLGVREPALELLFGGPPAEHAELARLASPVFFVDSNDPPMYLLHGDQDPQMPINQTHELHGAARAAGVQTVFEVVHGSGHGGAAFYTPTRTAAVAHFLKQALAARANTD